MDWNWFFSSIAQSAAAVVGIFGAFIITKVLSNQAQFAERSGRLQALKTTAAKLVDSANHLSFAWYVRKTQESVLEKAEDLLDQDADLEPEELYKRLKFPPFLPRELAIKALIDIKDRRERAAEEKRQRQVQLNASRTMPGLDRLLDRGVGTPGFIVERPIPAIRNLSQPYAALENERDAIDALEVEIRHHMRTITDFLQAVSSNPESSLAITWALVMVAALFLIGVIYPLSFLPVPTSWVPAVELHGFWSRVFSLRGLLLTVVASIFLAALTMFAVMNRRLRYAEEELQSLREFTHIGTYSAYYAVAEQNRKLGRENTAKV